MLFARTVLPAALILLFACKTSRKSTSVPPSDPATQPVTMPNEPVQRNDNQVVKHTKPEYGFFREILETNQGPFAAVFDNPEAYNLQIIYTQIDRDASGKPKFTDHVFRADANPYFYPASTVKMPTAILALQRLRELNVPGLDRHSTMITEADFDGQTPVYNDPTTPDGKPAIAHYIKKIFLVSDNDAFNRLYEFLGPHYINQALQQMGYTEAEIIHRLEVSMTEEQNRRTNPVRFLDGTGKTIYEQKGQYNAVPYAKRNERIGRAYMRGGKLVEEPMDFSRKNRLSLPSLHAMMKAVIFPESVPVRQRFFLEPEDYVFLRRYMSMTPSAAGFPPYDAKSYYDTYCKFLLFGADSTQRIPEGMKIFNKVGDAYGHLIDVAYVADAANGVEFLLSAVIYCNKDGVLNDDRYDYESVGYPFLKYIGQRIYFHEKARQKQHKPDLRWINQLY